MTQDPIEFMKMWTDLMFKTMQTGMASPSDGAPSDAFRQMRNGMFNSLSESWEAYMRTPQFLEQMKQSMDQAIAARKMFNEFMNGVSNTMQNAGKEDIDGIIAALRRMEAHVDQRFDEINAKMDALNARLDTLAKPTPRPTKKSAKKPAKKAPKK